MKELLTPEELAEERKIAQERGEIEKLIEQTVGNLKQEIAHKAYIEKMGGHYRLDVAMWNPNLNRPYQDEPNVKPLYIKYDEKTQILNKFYRIRKQRQLSV
jgi:hypothetical protein